MERNLLIFRKSTHAESHFQAQSLYKLLDLPNMSKFRPISDFFLEGVWCNPRVWKCFGTFLSVCIDHICIICSKNELFAKKSWTHAESPIFMHISFTMKYKRISKKNLKILKKLLFFFDSGYYTSLEMDQEHSEDVSINLSDHKITFFRF